MEGILYIVSCCDAMRWDGMGWDGMGWDGMRYVALYDVDSAISQRCKWIEYFRLSFYDLF